jgi:hypothetical protein
MYIFLVMPQILTKQGKAMTKKKEYYLKGENKPEVLDHMTRAEMIAEMMMMLNEVKDEDMPVVCDLIQQVMKKSSPGQ